MASLSHSFFIISIVFHYRYLVVHVIKLLQSGIYRSNSQNMVSIIINYIKSLHNLYQCYCDNCYHFHKHLSTEKGSFVDKIQVKAWYWCHWLFAQSWKGLEFQRKSSKCPAILINIIFKKYLNFSNHPWIFTRLGDSKIKLIF